MVVFWLFRRSGHWLKDGEGLMRVLAGRIDILLLGHEHRHLDFSGTDLSKLYRIPYIFSSGKSTQEGTEYAVNKKGEANKSVLKIGLPGKLIEIDPGGKVSAKTMAF